MFYSEGTWTPVPSYASGAASTVTISNARYVVVGRVCHISCDISFRLGTGSGTFVIGGLPFISVGNCSVSIGYLDRVTMAASTTMYAITNSGGVSIGLYTKVSDGTGTLMASASATNFASAGSDMRIMVGGSYEIAAV